MEKIFTSKKKSLLKKQKSYEIFFNTVTVTCVTKILTPSFIFDLNANKCAPLKRNPFLKPLSGSRKYIGALYMCRIVFSSITMGGKKNQTISWWFMVLMNSAEFQDIPSHRHQHYEVQGLWCWASRRVSADPIMPSVILEEKDVLQL